MPILIPPDMNDDSCRSTNPTCWMEDDDDGSGEVPPQQVYMNESAAPSYRHPRQQQHPAAAATPAVDLSIRRDREREGRCGDCGAQTHEFQYDQLAGRQNKVPLTVNGEVHRGRCLLCVPFNAQEALRYPQHYVADGINETSKSAGRIPSPPAGSSSSCSSSNHNRSYHPSNQLNSSYQQSPSMRRRVSGLTCALDLCYDPCDPPVRSALHALIDGNNDIVDILFAMKRVPLDPLIQERGCERLWILSWEDENAISIGRVGGITIILAAMARFPKNSYLQQCACESLQNLAALDEYNRREIAEQGGIDLIVRSMVNHVTVAGIQQSGCTALASMAASGEFNKDICRAGGVHALILASRQFADVEGVVRCVQDACQAMGLDPRNCSATVNHHHQYNNFHHYHPKQIEATTTR